MAFDKLFSPIKIRGLELPNRVVMSAMGTLFAAKSEDKRSVTDKLIQYHVVRAKGGSGLNTVEFHCGHNYLPHSFLSAAFNQRQDEWGGSLENRMRFPLECIRAIRANIPEDMPLFMRIVHQDDFVENGLTPEDVIAFCKEAGKLGVDVLNVSRGNIFSAATIYEVPPVDLPHGLKVHP